MVDVQPSKATEQTVRILSKKPLEADEPPYLTPEHCSADDGPPLLSPEEHNVENEPLYETFEPPVLARELPFMAHEQTLEEPPMLVCEQSEGTHEKSDQPILPHEQTFAVHKHPLQANKHLVEESEQTLGLIGNLVELEESLDIESEPLAPDEQQPELTEQPLDGHDQLCESEEDELLELKLELEIEDEEPLATQEQPAATSRQPLEACEEHVPQNQGSVEVKLELTKEEPIEGQEEQTEILKDNLKVQNGADVQPYRQCMMCLHWVCGIEEHLWMCKAKRQCLNRINVVKINTQREEEPSRAQEELDGKEKHTEPLRPKLGLQSEMNVTEKKAHVKCLMCLNRFSEAELACHLWMCKAKRSCLSKVTIITV